MTIRRGVYTALVVSAISLLAHGVWADVFAPDRFKGGTADGYASLSLGEEAQVASAMRFQGGSGDGYDFFTESDLQVPVRGTLIMVQ